MSHHNHALSALLLTARLCWMPTPWWLSGIQSTPLKAALTAKSEDFLMIRVHLVRERPKPASAPYLAAMVWQKHMRRRNPIQLKRKAVRKAVKKMKSLPSSAVSPIGEESRVDDSDASGSSSAEMGTRVSL